MTVSPSTAQAAVTPMPVPVTETPTSHVRALDVPVREAPASGGPTDAPAPDAPTSHAPAPDVPVDDAREALELVPWLARYRRRGRPGATYHRAKRLLDLVAVAGTAPVWGPMYAASALAVRFDGTGGRVHFAQERTVARGRRVPIGKLRTMVPDADARKAELAHLNEREWPDFKITDDPRITPVGRFLRATSLDELPQLVAVLRGDLSLVGPRPWSRTVDHHEPWHLDRYAVPAGLTGLWQVTARDADSFTERIRLDLAYKQRRCLRLDLEILLRTIPAVLGRQGS